MIKYDKTYIDDRGNTVDATDIRKELVDEAYKRWRKQETGLSEEKSLIDEIYMECLYPVVHDEYLEDGAILQCNQATKEVKNWRGKEYKVDTPSDETFLTVSENTKFKCCTTLSHATIRDCIIDENIKPFRCNCEMEPHNDEEWSKLNDDSFCANDGTCKALMKLNEKWDNLVDEKSYFEYEDNISGKAPGINMTSILFCKHGVIISPVTSGQENAAMSLEEALDKMTQYLRGEDISEEELHFIIVWVANNCGLTVNDMIQGQFSEGVNTEAHERSKRYDEQIIAWTYYWNVKIQNEFQVKFTIDPNIVKAMIAQESSFGLIRDDNDNNKNSSRNVMQSLATGNPPVWTASGINPYGDGMFCEGDTIAFKRLDGVINGNGGLPKKEDLPENFGADREAKHFQDFEILKDIFEVNEDGKYMVVLSKVTPDMSIATGIGWLANEIVRAKGNIYNGVKRYNSENYYPEVISDHLEDMGCARLTQ